MWEEDDIVIVSALEHYSYCPRQCGLILLEEVFDENVYTIRGRHSHETAHTPTTVVQRGVRIERALPIWSDRLGIVGIADAVEFRDDGRVYPVEWKFSARRRHRHDNIQLCAQALCLEEMLGRPVPSGAVYSRQSGRRREVRFTQQLRDDTEAVIREIRNMLKTRTLPAPANDERCPKCSLIDACQPEAVSASTRYRPDALFTISPPFATEQR
ncbi:MAG: CRISPR-associated protein Cas4 [Candidatus Methanomethyliaceae archaeon]